MSVKYSESFGTSRRSYRFDVKTAKSGSHYLVVTEESNRDGRRSRSQVMLFPEQAAEFTAALHGALAAMGMAEAGKAAGEKAVVAETAEAAQPRVRSRTRKKWASEEDAFLLDEFARGTALDELAKQLMRAPVELQSRLDRLGVSNARIPQARALEILAERKNK